MRGIFWVLLLMATVVRAQDSVRAPRIIVKLAPLALLNYDPTVQGAVEIRTGTQQSWQGEFGYSRLNWGTPSNSNTIGQREYWRARTEYRWYRSFRHSPYRRAVDTEHEAAPLGNYFAIEGYYKQINGVDQQTVGRDCVNGNCAYYQKVDNSVSRFVEAFYGKFGRQIAFSRADGKPGRFLFDVAVGLGVRGVQVTRFGDVTDSYSDNYFSRAGRLGTNLRALYPDVTINMKFGYAF